MATFVVTAAVDSTGKKLVLTPSTGYSGSGLAVTSAAGILPHASGVLGNYIVPTATPTVVGGTVEVVLPVPFLSGETLQLNLTVANTIVDGAGNTAAVVTNQSVTNNSTVSGTNFTYSSNASKIVVNGATRFDSNGLNSGFTSLYASGGTTFGAAYSAELVIEVTAGTVDLQLLCNRATVTTLNYSVDNAANATLGNGAGSPGYELLPIATSLGVGRHLIRHDLINNFFCIGLRWSGSGTASIVSTATPVIAFVDNVTGYNIQTGVTPAKIWGTRNLVTFTGTYQYVNNQFTGVPHVGFQFNVGCTATGLDTMTLVPHGVGGPKVTLGVAIDQTLNTTNYTSIAYTPTGLGNTTQAIPVAIGMSAGAHTVEMVDASAGSFYWLRAYNGTKLASAASIGDGTISVSDITHIADGDWLCLDHAQNDEVVKVVSHTGSGPYTLTLSANIAKSHASGAAVRAYTPASAPTFSAGTKPAFNGILLTIGDSIAKAFSYTTAGVQGAADHALADPRASHSFMACKAATWEWIDAATEGYTAAQLATENASNNIAGLLPNVVEVEVLTNDFIQQLTVATSQSSLGTIYGQIKTATPAGNVKILTQKVFSNTQTAGAAGKTKADYNAAQLAAMTSAAASGWTFKQIDWSRSLTKTNLSADIPDNIHPSWTTGGLAGTGGQNKAANEFLPHLSPPTTSGTTGTVTYSLPGGATFTGLDTVTLAPSAGTPTLTSSGAMVNNGDGTWTVTPTAGTSAVTFTNSATATITYTNGQGWNDPAATSYVAAGIHFRRRPGLARSGTRTAIYN